MAIFATHVVLMHEFQAVSFAPGDELPEWAEGMVGAHCLEPELDSEDDEDSDADAEEAESEAEDSAPAAESAPDFTGATPAPRRGRPRKQ